MATLQESLRSNPFKDMIIPVIAELQSKYTTFEEKAVVAQLLSNRLNSWGEQMYFLTPRAQRFPLVYKPGQRVFENGLGYRSIPVFRDYKGTKTLEQQLKSMSMSQPNDLIYFNQIIDVFYANVDFISYYAVDYKGGTQINYVLESLSLIQRAGSSLTGLLVSTPQQGSDGPAKASTTIIVDSIVGGDDGKYFTAYSDDTNLEVVWLNVDGGGAAPVLDPILGVTINYVPVVTGSGATPVELRASIKNAVNTAARMSAVDGAGTDVIVSTLVNGVATVTFDQDIPTTGTWAYAFVNGTLDPIQAEITKVDVTNVVPLDLNSKYFTMWDGPVRKYGFWFNIANGGSIPTDVTVTDWVQVRTGNVDKAGIKTELDIVIGNLGVWTIDSQTEFSTDWISPSTGIQTDSDAATAGKGIANAVTDLFGADGALLASGLDSDEIYASVWNGTKVPYDTRHGVETPYLKSTGGPASKIVIASLGCVACNSLKAPAPPDTSEPGFTAYKIYQACLQESCPGLASINDPGVFIVSPVPSDLSFNWPPPPVHRKQRPPGR